MIFHEIYSSIIMPQQGLQEFIENRKLVFYIRQIYYLLLLGGCQDYWHAIKCATGTPN